MIVYEVTADVDPSVAQSFERFLVERHIPDLLATGCFVSAELLRDADGYRISYTAADSEILDRYLTEHAPRLRDDLKEHFPTGVGLSRRIFEIVSEFPSAR